MPLSFTIPVKPDCIEPATYDMVCAMICPFLPDNQHSIYSLDLYDIHEILADIYRNLPDPLPGQWAFNYNGHYLTSDHLDVIRVYDWCIEDFEEPEEADPQRYEIPEVPDLPTIIQSMQSTVEIIDLSAL